MEICEKNKCSGCLLCESVCSKGAVEIKTDEAGFLYPSVNEEKCISCGLCRKKCPVNYTNVIPHKKAYAAYTTDKEIRKSSSSGGVFATLATAVLKEGGAVFGAGYDSELQVLHKSAETPEELLQLMGSKYVQSNTRGIFKKVAAKLEEGRMVLFCGTPCQCAALRNFVGEKENLLIVDFLCHGVPSPVIWKKYLDENFNSPESASFRNKRRGWQEFSMEVKHRDGVYSGSMYNDPYLRMFQTNSIVLRMSCHDCSWKEIHHSSDITVADFWGLSKVFPDMNDDKGCSAVLLRSEKGINAFKAVQEKLKVRECTLEDIKKSNVAYDHSVDVSKNRAEFVEDISNNVSFEEIKAKYYKPANKKEIRKIKMKNFAKKIIGKISRLKRR